MADGPLGEDSGRIRDNTTGKTYDIEGDKATENVDGPIYGRDRDAEVLAGGAGTLQPGYFADEETQTDTDTYSAMGEEKRANRRDMNETPGGDSVAQSAELGQKPLEAYKRDAERPGADDDPNRRVNDIGRGSERSASEVSNGTVGASVGAATGGSSRDHDEVRTVTANPGRSSAGTSATAGATANDSAMSGTGEMADRARDVGQSAGNRITDNSNDNSAEARGGDLLAQVQAGYKVVDSNGDEIGKVRDLKDGDERSASTEGETAADLDGDQTEMIGLATVPGGASGNNPGGSGAGVPGVLVVDEQDDDEPRAEGSLRDGLIRVGYLRIDSKGWFTHDRYARADQITSVDGETVRLSVPKDALAERR